MRSGGVTGTRYGGGAGYWCCCWRTLICRFTLLQQRYGYVTVDLLIWPRYTLWFQLLIAVVLQRYCTDGARYTLHYGYC